MEEQKGSMNWLQIRLGSSIGKRQMQSEKERKKSRKGNKGIKVLLGKIRKSNHGTRSKAVTVGCHCLARTKRNPLKPLYISTCRGSATYLKTIKKKSKRRFQAELACF